MIRRSGMIECTSARRSACTQVDLLEPENLVFDALRPRRETASLLGFTDTCVSALDHGTFLGQQEQSSG